MCAHRQTAPVDSIEDLWWIHSLTMLRDKEAACLLNSLEAAPSLEEVLTVLPLETDFMITSVKITWVMNPQVTQSDTPHDQVYNSHGWLTK